MLLFLPFAIKLQEKNSPKGHAFRPGFSIMSAVGMLYDTKLIPSIQNIDILWEISCTDLENRLSVLARCILRRSRPSLQQFNRIDLFSYLILIWKTNKQTNRQTKAKPKQASKTTATTTITKTNKAKKTKQHKTKQKTTEAN